MTQQKKKRYELFAANLRRAYENWHKETGKTQADLASLVGLSDRKSISNYLNAVNYPEEDVLKKMCETLNTTPDELNGTGDLIEEIAKLEQYRLELEMGERKLKAVQKVLKTAVIVLGDLIQVIDTVIEEKE